MDCRRCPKRVGGFTLLEVLAVIAVVGILAGVLTPVFLGAREKSRQGVCAGNLSQLYKAIAMYSQDNDGFRPMYGVGALDVRIDGREVTLPDQSTELVQSLWPYGATPEEWFCPDDPSHGRANVFKRHPATSYACQTALYIPASGSALPVQLFLTGRALTQTPLLADDILNCAPGPPNTFRYMHGQRFNVVYYDGHVRAEQALDVNALGDCHP